MTIGKMLNKEQKCLEIVNFDKSKKNSTFALFYLCKMELTDRNFCIMDQDLKKDEQTLERNVQSVENKNVAEAKKSEDEAVATVNFNAMERGELLEAAKVLKNPSALAIKRIYRVH